MHWVKSLGAVKGGMEDPAVYCMQAVNCYQTNPERAVALFERAAELGSPEGYFGLAE